MAQTPNNMTEHPIEIYSALFAQKDPHLLSARSGVAYDAQTQRFNCTLLGRGVAVLWPSMEAVYVAEAGGAESGAEANLQGAVGGAEPRAAAAGGVVGNLATADASAAVEAAAGGVAVSTGAAGGVAVSAGAAGGVAVSAGAAVEQGALSEAAVDDKSRILLGRLLLEGTLVPAAGKFLSYEEIPNGEQYYEPFHGRCIMRLAYMFRSADEFSAACEALGGSAVASTADAAYEFDFLEGLKMRLLYWQADDEFGPNAQFLFSDNFLLAFTSDDIACAGDIILGALKKCR